MASRGVSLRAEPAPNTWVTKNNKKQYFFYLSRYRDFLTKIQGLSALSNFVQLNLRLASAVDAKG